MTSAARHTRPELPSARRVLDETVTLVGLVVVAGPPAFVALGALVFATLMLAGPFAAAVAMALVAVSVVVLVTAVVAIVATPYALLRRARRYRASHPFLLVGHRARARRAMPAALVGLGAAAPVVVRREPLA
jgi:membrane protein YdbS with pleckstrin-like domain